MARYDNTKVSQTKVSQEDPKTIAKYNTTIYARIPERNDDIFVITQDGDRLDNLAFQFYGDSHLWWYIAQANNIRTMNIAAGTSLRIPVSTDLAFGE